jgi:threonine dehydrogenase-like Zn-dependent dehydrogenase
VICNGGADIVVESSGVTPGVRAAYKLLRKKPQAYGTDYKVEPISFYHGDWPRVVMQANYIEDVSINPFTFTPGEGAIVITPSDRGVEDRQKVVEAIRKGAFDPGKYVERLVGFEKAPESYAALAAREVLSVAFQWNEEGAK